MLKILLKLMSDDQKIKKIQNNYDFYPGEELCEIIFSIKDKAKRDETILGLPYKTILNSIIPYMDDDKTKIELMREIEENIKPIEKALIISLIEDDKMKIELMREIEEEVGPKEKAIIISSIEDDKTKIELMQTTEELGPREKAIIISSIEDDKTKIELMRSTKGLYSIEMADIIDSIQNEKNRIRLMQIIPELSSGDKMQIINGLQDSNKIIEALQTANKLTSIEKALLIASIEDDTTKIKLMQTTDGFKSEDKARIICSIEDDMTKIKLMQTTDGFKSEDKARIICSIEDDTSKIKLMQTTEGIEPKDKASIMGTISLKKIKKLMHSANLSSDIWNKYRIYYADIDFIDENMKFFLKNAMSNLENIDLARETLSRMFKKNNEVVKGLDFRLLDQKYLDTLGEERINLISCYPDIQEQIIKLSDEQLYIFDKCIDVYVEQNETDEWTLLAQNLLDHIGEYDSLIGSLDDIKNISKEDFIDLARIMQGENWCEISSIDDVREYDRIKSEKCQKLMEDENATLEQKKQAVYQKIFGHDITYAKKMIEKFGEDIENVDDCEMKDYIRTLKMIDTIDNSDVLQEIFEKCDFAELDKVAAERELKTEYGKKFFEDLYVPQERDRQDKTSNIYEVGTDFKIMLTSIGAYYLRESNIDNYRDDWNRPVISSQHFCASYIRNDMIGTAPITSICYGFSQMKEDSLMLSGPVDIFSSGRKFKPTANNSERYLTPNAQIDNTYVHNEMCFRRIQGGVKKQPDYIVVFRRNGQIDNLEEAQKASEQWGGMPIVVVDVDKCLEIEEIKVNEMITEYDQNPSIELAKEIVQKVRNNRQTDGKFCITLGQKLTQLRKTIEDAEKKMDKRTTEKQDSTKEPTVSEEELIENNEAVSAKERENGVRKIRDIYNKVIEAVKEGHDGR